MTETPAAIGHNTRTQAEIDQMIIDADGRIEALEAARKDINHQIKNILDHTVRDELGMNIKHFKAIRKLLKEEQDEQESFFDTCRKMTRSLGKGQTLNWLDAVEKMNRHQSSPPPTENVVDMSTKYVHASTVLAGDGSSGI